MRMKDTNEWQVIALLSACGLETESLEIGIGDCLCVAQSQIMQR